MNKMHTMNLTLKNFSVDSDDRNVVTVTLDVPGRSMNVLDRDVMRELCDVITALEKADAARAVIFRSGKESGFLAGADVNVIAQLTAPEQARELIEAGQNLFARVARLPMPTVVVIHGPCLGGGLEFAMACDHRIARDNSSTQIGLPEIKLGLIPGWGGTQRLPHLVGMKAAVEMILQGRFLDAKKAARLGLIDQAVAPETWEADVSSFVDRVAGKPRKRAARGGRPRRWTGRLIDETSAGRAALLWWTRRHVADRTDHYPAIEAALRSIAAGYRSGGDGYAVERDEFMGLVATPTSKNLIGLFLAREKARELRTWTPTGLPALEDPIRVVGVIGGGAMGAGIGQLAACRGFDVQVLEVDQAAAEKSRATIKASLVKLAGRKRWSKVKRQDVAERVHVGCDPGALADCDLIVEAVVERADVKREVFANMDAVAKPSAIFATNTSSLSVDELSTATRRAGDFAGLHFFNPVHRMELVEVVRGRDTSAETLSRLVGFVRALGKTPIVTGDAPGFLVNRVLFPYLGEAVKMVRQGYEADRIDREVRRFGMPMGPLELLDRVGLDVGLHVARSLRDVIGDTSEVVDCLAVMCEHGRLGVKADGGFYEYHKGKRREVATLPAGVVRSQYAAIACDFRDDGLTDIQRRVIYPMLGEAVRCLDAGIVDEAWAVDLAMVLGTGFAPHTGGPLHWIDRVGQAVVRDNFERLAIAEGNRFDPPKRLKRMADLERNFLDRPSLSSG